MTSRDETKQASSQPAKWIRIRFPLGEISPLGKWAQVGINTVTQLRPLSHGLHKTLAGASRPVQT